MSLNPPSLSTETIFKLEMKSFKIHQFYGPLFTPLKQIHHCCVLTFAILPILRADCQHTFFSQFMNLSLFLCTQRPSFPHVLFIACFVEMDDKEPLTKRAKLSEEASILNSERDSVDHCQTPSTKLPQTVIQSRDVSQEAVSGKKISECGDIQRLEVRAMLQNHNDIRESDTLHN